MATVEESRGTVLHRLIQEQLRYGNPTDTRTLLAIQEQALRGGGGPSCGVPPRGDNPSESISQDESQFLQLSDRQEPQGQEHQGDPHSESDQLYRLHGEELPTYEQAKAHSQYLASHWGAALQLYPTETPGGFREPSSEGGARQEVKRGHMRTLSERLLQLAAERSAAGAAARQEAANASSHSYPLLPCYPSHQVLQGQGQEHLFPRPEYRSPSQTHGFMPTPEIHPVGNELPCYPRPIPSSQPRYVPPVHLPEARHCTFPTLPPGGLEVYTTAHSQMEMLLSEHERLRQELEGQREKTSRIQKLEEEIKRITAAYETLSLSCRKRQGLEETLRTRLTEEIQRLQDCNTQLREGLENARRQTIKEAKASDHNQQIMAKLLEQNEEQQLERERVEREVLRLRGVGEELCHRVEELEEALSSARGRSQRLQEELRRKREYVEKVERLQRSFAQLQAASEKREGLEGRLRTHLEQELRSLRAQQRQSQPAGVALCECLREREERVLALEADTLRWEQKYLEESAMRQFAMDAAATAAAQRDTTIINCSPSHSSNNSFNEDLSMADLRNQEMENRIRALHAQILEKDAVIQIFQQRLDQADHGKWGQSLPPTQTDCGSQVKGMSPISSPHQTSSTASVPCQTQGSALQPGLACHTKEPVCDLRPSINPLQSDKEMFRGIDDLEPEAVEVFI